MSKTEKYSKRSLKIDAIIKEGMYFASPTGEIVRGNWNYTKNFPRLHNTKKDGPVKG